MSSTMPARSSAILILLPPGAFLPARLMLAPAGARLPAGVRRVVAVPAVAGYSLGDAVVAVPAVAGSTRWVAAASALAGSEAANTADDDSRMIFEELLQAEGDKVLGLLAEVAPPCRHRVARYELLKRDVNDLVATATGGKEDKTGCAISLIRAAYALVRVAHWAYPSDRLEVLPEFQMGSLEQTFVRACLGTDESVQLIDLAALTPIVSGIEPVGEELSDGDVALLTGVRVAVKTAASAAGTARSLYDESALLEACMLGRRLQGMNYLSSI